MSVPRYGQFELLAQVGNEFVIETGVAYDGYGNRLCSAERTTITLDFPAGLSQDGAPPASYGFLCARRQQYRVPQTYLEHPVSVLPTLVNYDQGIEFYLSATVLQTAIGGATYYYPPLDSYGVISGLVLAKVYVLAAYAPDITYRSPLLAVKDGIFLPMAGFNLG